MSFEVLEGEAAAIDGSKIDVICRLSFCTTLLFLLSVRCTNFLVLTDFVVVFFFLKHYLTYLNKKFCQQNIVCAAQMAKINAIAARFGGLVRLFVCLFVCLFGCLFVRSKVRLVGWLVVY